MQKVEEKVENIKDLFHRKIDYVRISVTDRCNFRCTYCMPQGQFIPMSHTDILTFEEIERLCRIFADVGIHKVKLTGGEPLARKDFVSLVRKINQIKGIEQVTMTTNGSLLGGYVSELAEAGLAGINISLDTLKPDVFRELTGTEELSNVLDAIHKTSRAGIPSVKINCVPMKGVNDDEICEIAAFAKDAPIEVRFIEMMPIGQGKGQAGIGEEEVRRKLETVYGSLKPVNAQLGNGPASYVQPEGFQGHIGFISALSHKFCESCNRIRLTSDGILKPCLQYAGRVSLKEMLRGKASDEQIEAVIRQTILEKPQCHQFRETNDVDSKKEALEERIMAGIGG